MSKFVHVDFPATHLGVERVENAVSFLKTFRFRFDDSRTLAAMLVTALVAALLVVANQVIETITDGHLLAAWIGLWAVGFAAMALLMDTVFAAMRSLRSAMSLRVSQWRQAQRSAQQDADLMALASSDHRVMADVRAAASFSQ